MTEAMVALARVGMLTFVVCGMLGTGLALTPRAVLAPLRDVRIVAGLLAANFVAMPVVAVALSRALPLEDDAAVAIVLLGCCAGAPFLPVLGRLAHGDAALAAGAMVLLMVTTVAFVPVVVPLVIEGATVTAGDIATSLVVLMLLPLSAGLFAASRWPSAAVGWSQSLGSVSNAAIVLALGAAVAAGWRDLLGSAGSWVFVGTAVLTGLALAVGWIVAVGQAGARRRVLALGTAQRNIAAALVVAAPLGDGVVVRTLAAALMLQVVLLVVAAELGKRSDSPAPGEVGASGGTAG